jgi:hypothetical protein
MKGKVIADWTKANFATEGGRRLVFDAVNHFVSATDRDKEVRQAVTHFATKADGPAKVKELIEKYHLENAADQGWRVFFAFRDYTSTTQDGFRIRDVASGLTFRLIPEGGEIKFAKMAGSDVTVGFNMYGAGLAWHRTLIDDQDWWSLEDNAIAFRNKWLQTQARIGCGLIEALPQNRDVAWQDPTPAALAVGDPRYTASRDANTIEAACLQILIDMRAAGYDVSASTPFVLLAPLQLRNRISAALSLTQNGVTGTPKATQFSIQAEYTLEFAAATSYYIGIPGLKSIWGTRKNLTVESKYHLETYSDVAAGWARLGAAIGETRQFARCATA